ncbi:uncharacterized protein TrAFT101_009684 [Trichoderma asperellum]|uniref:uncharacterized protein n=1 Tax=Trichoderma asperellum TaxID=101201 RepID=UPI0033198892|nr:hypothetical protein TrAFT101_009684 [Trichoderma asperellum]
MPIGNLGWEEDEVPFISLERGIATHVYAAFEPSLKDSRLANPYSDTIKPWATSKVEVERLWKLSEKLVGQEFAY